MASAMVNWLSESAALPCRALELDQSLNETLDAAAKWMQMKLNENSEKAPLQEREVSILSLKSISVGVGQGSLLTLQRTFPTDLTANKHNWGVSRYKMCLDGLLSFVNKLALSWLYC